MPFGIKEKITRELGDRNPMEVTVEESAVEDPFFTEVAFPQFLKCLGMRNPLAAASRLGLLCFQAGMLYERARVKASRNVVEMPKGGPEAAA